MNVIAYWWMLNSLSVQLCSESESERVESFLDRCLLFASLTLFRAPSFLFRSSALASFPAIALTLHLKRSSNRGSISLLRSMQTETRRGSSLRVVVGDGCRVASERLSLENPCSECLLVACQSEFPCRLNVADTVIKG